MEYPTDQMELKLLLLSDPDLAMEWFDENCESFIRKKFNSYHVDNRIKARSDLDELTNRVRLLWWDKILPIYDVTKVKTLGAWTCYCSKRNILTYFGSFKTLRKTQLRMLSLYDITNKFPDGKERDVWINDRREGLNRSRDEAADQVDLIVEKLGPKLTKKEMMVLQSIVYCYRHRPDLIRGGSGDIPMDKIAALMKINPRIMDNGMQRIRRKMRELGLT